MLQGYFLLLIKLLWFFIFYALFPAFCLGVLMNMRKVYDEIRLNVGRECSQMFLVLVCVLFGL